MMRTGSLRLWLLVVLSFVLTMPGAIAFANWDAPYGFYKDLAIWLSCASSALVFVILYGVYEWRRGKVGRGDLMLLALLWGATVLIGRIAEGRICGQMGYQCGLLIFVLGGFMGFFLSLMALPGGLWMFLSWRVYPYDRPLLIVWYLLFAGAVILSIESWRREKRKKAQGTT